MHKKSDPYEELASMFLTGDGNGTSSMNISRAREHAAKKQQPGNGTIHSPVTAPRLSAPTLELLIVRHLPVRGNLWLTPYADALARDAGCTALLRLDGPEPSIQLLHGPAVLASAPFSNSMGEVIEELDSSVGVWVLCAPSGCTAAECAAVAARTDRITLLTSADEAAVIAAYQTIKELALAAGDSPLPPVYLAVVAADQTKAAAMVERLSRTTVGFLGMGIHLGLCLPRIDAGLKSTRYIGFGREQSMAIHDVMTQLVHVKQRAEANAADAPHLAGRTVPEADAEAEKLDHLLRHPHPVAPASATNEVKAAEPSTRSPAAAARVSVTPEISEFAGIPAPSAPPRTPMPRRPHIKLAPKPVASIEAKQQTRPTEPDDRGKPVPLATYIEGLKLLPVRSPGHERIELAVDRAGHMHLLGNEQTLREMRIVEKWIASHRELLAMACPQHPIDTLGTTHCHIFSDRPASLADLHGTNLHLHVLAPVIVSGQTGWYSAPLNTLTGV